MNLRLTLYELIARHDLDAPKARRLAQIAGLEGEPEGLSGALPRGVAVLAAALAGLGVILWVAANWDLFGRTGRFALLQGVVLCGCGAAFARPALRAPLGLLSLLGIGGLLAYFGQTYQTGADPWQLFALWSVLALPLALAARSDIVWAPWALVAMTAISLWTHAYTGHDWRFRPHDLGVHALAFASAVAVVLGLGRRLQTFTGAGVWALRTATTLTVVMVTLAALGGLFDAPVAAHYALGLGVLAGAAAFFARRRTFDVYGLSAVAFGLVSLLVAGLARWLWTFESGDRTGSMLIIGLSAAGLVAAAVSLILRAARARAEPGGAP